MGVGGVCGTGGGRGCNGEVCFIFRGAGVPLRSVTAVNIYLLINQIHKKSNKKLIFCHLNKYFIHLLHYKLSILCGFPRRFLNVFTLKNSTIK